MLQGESETNEYHSAADKGNQRLSGVTDTCGSEAPELESDDIELDEDDDERIKAAAAHECRHQKQKTLQAFFVRQANAQ